MLSWVFRNRARLLPLYAPALGIESRPVERAATAGTPGGDPIALEADAILREFEAEVLVSRDDSGGCGDDGSGAIEGCEPPDSAAPTGPTEPGTSPVRPPTEVPASRTTSAGQIRRRARYTLLCPMPRRST